MPGMMEAEYHDPVGHIQDIHTSLGINGEAPDPDSVGVCRGLDGFENLELQDLEGVDEAAAAQLTPQLAVGLAAQVSKDVRLFMKILRRCLQDILVAKKQKRAHKEAAVAQEGGSVFLPQEEGGGALVPMAPLRKATKKEKATLVWLNQFVKGHSELVTQEKRNGQIVIQIAPNTYRDCMPDSGLG